MEFTRLISAAVCAVFVVSGSAYAKVNPKNNKNEKTYKYNYTVTYETFTDEKLSAQVGSDTVLAETKVIDTVPHRDGYEFGGWSVSGYNSDEVYSGGDTLKLDSSAKLYAVWRSEGSCVLSYLDGKENILPMQRVYGRGRITELIPQKKGYTFIGWSKDSKPTAATFAPGDEADISEDTDLYAVWSGGETAAPDVAAIAQPDGTTVFSWEPIKTGGKLDISVVNIADGERLGFTADAEAGTLSEVLGSGQYAVSAAVTVNSGRFARTANGRETRFFVPEYPSDEIKVFADGRKVEFDAPPFITNGSTMVPMRAVLEALGAQVTWNSATASAEAVCNTVVTKFTVGSTVFSRNGASGYLPEAAALADGRTYIPLRAISESFGFTVDWYEDGRAVYIFSQYPPGIAPDVYYIKDAQSGKYLAYDSEKSTVYAASKADFGAAWAVQPSGDFFEIYPLSEPDKPLEVQSAEMFEGTPLRVWTRNGYDGYVWRIERLADGAFSASPYNSGSLSLDVDAARISKQNSSFVLEPVGLG